MVVTVYTICFKIDEINIVPKKCFYVFHMILTKRAVISLYIINWLVFAIVTQCVDCDVGNGF
jgi:hypothetical protein